MNTKIYNKEEAEHLVMLQDEKAVTTSLQIAKVFEKQHKNVIQAIESKINSADFSAQYKNMFSEGSYKDTSGKENKMYYMDRNGFTFIAFGFTGSRADDFKLRYIEAFNRMEEQIKKPVQLTAREQMNLIMQVNEETAQRVDVIETDIQKLKETTRIDTLQEKQLSDIVKRKVLDAVGGKNSNAYSIAPRVFPDAWRVLKNHFCISSYKSLPRLKYDEAVELMNLWQPSASLQLEINSLNKQMDFGDDLK